MDVVVTQGDQLIIEIDVVDAVGDPLDLTGFDVRYVVEGQINIHEGEAGVEIVDGMGTKDRVRLTIDISFAAGKYRHECKIEKTSPTPDVGPATILGPGWIFVEKSLIGSVLNG